MQINAYSHSAAIVQINYVIQSDHDFPGEMISACSLYACPPLGQLISDSEHVSMEYKF